MAAAPVLGIPLREPASRRSPYRATASRSHTSSLRPSPLSPESGGPITWHKCFSSTEHLGRLLEELNQEDFKLSCLLEAREIENRQTSPDSDDSTQTEETIGLSALSSYQEFVNSSVSFILQSEFPSGLESKYDPYGVVFSLLVDKKCPELAIFCRVAVNPTAIASDLPENDNPCSHKGIPVNQLARYCDIAVLRFLTTATDHTKPFAILWALKYLINLLNSEISSINSTNSLGWYGTPVRIKKGTILSRVSRHSITGPPIPPGINPPLVVVGSPPRELFTLDPETGQPIDHRQQRSPSPSERLPQNPSSKSLPVTRSLSSNNSMPHPKSAGSLQEETEQGPTAVAVSKPRGRRTSRQEPQSLQPFLDPERSHEHSPPRVISAQPFLPPARRLSPAVIPAYLLPPMESIPEEGENELSRSFRGTHMGSTESNETEEEFIGSPEPEVPRLKPHPPDLRSGPALGSIQEEEEGITSPLGFEQERLRSPSADSFSRSSAASSDDLTDSSDVRMKPISLQLPDARDIPDVDVQKELESLITAEGRISLIAILHAVANLPQSQNIWTQDIGLQCFFLMQLCMNLGLVQKSEDTEEETTASRRKKFQKQENIAFQKIGAEKPCNVHSKYIAEYSINALIQCATNMIIGCTHEAECRLSYKHLPNQNTSIHNKLIHYLRRLHDHSNTHFRQTLTKFASTAPCRKLFHFLHVVLQYCIRGRDFMKMDAPLKLSVVSSVLWVTVERLIELDTTEPLIQESITAEACSFFQYAQALFSLDLVTHAKIFRHFHMYMHRIALSVMLPPHPPARSDSPLRAPPPEDLTLSDDSTILSSITMEAKALTMPRKKKEQLQGRKRAGTVHITSPTSPEEPPVSTPQLGQAGKSPRSGHRVHLSKQTTGVERSSIEASAAGFTPQSERKEVGISIAASKSLVEWRGLHLDLLRGRIQRLVVLMNLSEPGTIPDPGMLASLIDLADGTSVVARAMIFMECALFVKKLRTSVKEWPTAWMTHNSEGGQNVCLHLKKWAEAVGEKLRLTELREKEMANRLKTVASKSDGPILLPEEPVFPADNDESKDESDPDKFQAVSYAVKMSACILLLEITRFLRDPPSYFVSVASSQAPTPRVSTVLMDLRKGSIASIISSDGESLKGANTLFPGDVRPQLGRPLSENPPSHFGSTLSVEDHEPPWLKSRSMDDAGLTPPTSPGRRKVSFYLRVNSTGPTFGGVGGRTSTIRKPPIAIRVLDSISPAEAHSSPHSSPSVRLRRQSLSATASSSTLHPAAATSGGVSGGSLHKRPSYTPTTVHGTGFHRRLPAKYRRKSEMPYSSHHQDVTLEPPSESRPPLQQQASIVSTKSFKGGLLNQGLTRLKRSAQRAFRIKKKTSADIASPESSPGLARRRKLLQQRISQTGSVSHPLYLLEDSWHHYPWLDVVEHLIVMEAFNPEARQRHKRACQELTVALKAVYVSDALDTDTDETDQGPSSLRISRSLSTLFAPLLPPVDTEASSQHPQYHRFTSLPSTLHTPLSRKRSSWKIGTLRAASVPGTSQPRSLSHQFAGLNFGRVQYATFTSSFLSMIEDTNIELFLEEESAFTKAKLSTTFNKQRRDYINMEFTGLVHAPFSVLVHAAPILHSSTFSSLKEVAWEALLDPDQELAQAAGAFFLLACAKESDLAVKSFVSEKVEKAGAVKQKEAIQRFQVLWQTRYGVWPRMEERAQKKFNMYQEKEKDEKKDQQSIGYSLPANLLGHPGAEIPMAPWEPVSVCTGTNCEVNPGKCFRSTRLAPIIHKEELSRKVESYSVTGVSVAQEASSKPANVYYGIGSEDATGNINEIQWEAVEPTLFPRSLLPLIKFVIMTLHPRHPGGARSATASTSASDIRNTSSDVSEAAREAVWMCMVEDPRLFFRPLLNQFNKLYCLITDKRNKSAQTQVESQLADILRPLHVVLQAFPMLPPQTAHYLFNNFVGIIMRHTDQPYHQSAKVVRSVLALTAMVVPSVQGLDSKVLKSVLKKESCYTTIMTTARIRGVERVCVAMEVPPYDRKVYDVRDDMTFGQLIAEVRGVPLSVDLLQNWYLVDENKELPLLSSLVVQDHYSSPADRQYPTFLLKRANQLEVNLWSQQMDQLFLHKMSEITRVLLTTRLLLTGPEVERGFSYSEFAQPNYRFIHSELVELNSFPRKALTSIIYEAGSSALQHRELRVSDIMLKGMWVQFILELFRSVKPDYDWSNSMILFLNVINGSLLLHSEDHTILKFCLASLLTAASKFKSVFKRDGYQMIVPTLVQVYTLHLRNQMITEALKFIWSQFYLLDQNIFLLQAIAATAILLSEEAALLSVNVSTTFPSFTHSQTLEGEVMQRNHARAVFNLINCLNVDSKNLPPDELDILGCIPLDLDGRQRLQPEGNWSRLTLQNAFFLFVTLARWNPEALRGMQVLVFLDYLMPLFLQAFSSTPGSFLPSFALSSIKHLVKGCDTITKPQTRRGDILSTKKQNDAPPTQAHAQPEPSAGQKKKERVVRQEAPRPSVVAQSLRPFRMLINRNKRDVSISDGSVHYSNPSDRKVQAPSSAMAPIDHLAYVGEFKLRRIQDANQRVLRLSRESLLSLSTKFTLHFSQEGGRGGRKDSTSRQERQRVYLDPPSVLILTSIVIQQLKQGAHNETVLQGKGLNSFMLDLLPNIEWTEAYYSSFLNLVVRLFKLFRKLQTDSSKALLVWENLANFLKGITLCIQRQPYLVRGHEQHLSKLKQLLETIVSVNTTAGQQSSPRAGGRLRVQRHLLHSAPTPFSEAVVGLAAQLICATQPSPNMRFRYLISDLLSQKLMVRDPEENIMFNKILLPLCIQLSTREDICSPSWEDAMFVLQNIDKKVENVLKVAPIRSSSHPSQVLHPEPFFRGLKVVCCAFAETFTLQDWHRVAQWVLSLAQRKLNVPPAVAKKFAAVSKASEHIPSQTSGRHLSPRSSSSSVTMSSTLLDSYLMFHTSLLNFFETFLVVYRVPLFSLLWPLLGQVEAQLRLMLKIAMVDNPALFDDIRSCIEKCHTLQREGSSIPSSISRQMLLRELQEELSRESSHGARGLNRSMTTVERRPQQKPPLRRRRSSMASGSLSRIGESHEENASLLASSGKRQRSPAPVAAKKSPEPRPTFLRLGTPPPSKDDPRKKPADAIKPKKQTTLQASPMVNYNPLEQTRKAYTKKRSPMRTLSPSSPSPASSPVPPRRSPRPPPLVQLKGIGSSEFHADTEDSDFVSPEVSPRQSTITPPPPKRLIIPNRPAISMEKEEHETKVPAAHITIQAEIHESAHERSLVHQSPGISRSVPVLDVTSFSSGDATQDSETILLNPDQRTFLSIQSSSQPELDSCDPHSESDTDSLLVRPKPRPKASKTEDFSQAKKLSLDRRQLGNSLKELGAGIKESSHFIYKNLKDANDDSSLC